ncbi:MAG: amino acid adenylation domain-containing protein [Geminicoccaceae bacterium]
MMIERAAARDADPRPADPRPAAARPGPGAGLELTLGQRRIWSLDRIGRVAEIGLQRLALRLRGPLDPTALIGALARLERRHGLLRAQAVQQAGGHVRLEVGTGARLALVSHDLGRLAPAAREPALAALLDPTGGTGFDLAQEPPARAWLARLGEAEHVLALELHPLVADPAALRLLAAELATLYAALAQGAAPVLPPAPAAGDRAGQEAAWLRSAPGRAALDFWRQRLAATEELAALPSLAVADADRLHARRLHRRSLGRARSQALRMLAARLRAPVPHLLQAALHLLLARYRAGAASRIGMVAAQRGEAATAALLDRLEDIVPVELRLDGGTRFAEAVAAIAAAEAEATGRQVPFELLAQALGDGCLPILFEWRARFALEAFAQAGLAAEPVADAPPRADAPLLVLASEGTDGTIELTLGYDAARFTAATIARAADHLLRILDAACADPELTLRQVALVEAGELAQLSAPYPDADPWDDVPVHLHIAAQARARPDATAILHADRRWSHDELNRWANRLAHGLLALGLAAEERVAVALPRSPEAMAAILAVLKAGGAFVPVDSDHPRLRNHHILADAGVRAVITAEAARAKLPGDLAVPVVTLAELAAGQPEHDPEVGIAGDQLAYVIYTSGSTGLPKGVAVEHGPLTRHCQSTGLVYGMSERSLELPFLPFSSDGGHERWLVPLMLGGGVVLPDRPLLTPEETFALIRRHGVSNASLPTTYLQQLAEWADRTGDAPPMRLYSFGGEGLPKATFDLLARSLRAEWLINGYGPTETIMTPMVWKIRPDTGFAGMYAPIGRAVGLRRVYVLDADLNPVPIGVTGEIHLGGDGVARGYVGRPELTAERFIPDPFGPPGSRLYRSGDLGRWREDGTIEFVGRVDHQVKLRGFRIEPGEIEAALLAQPGVGEAVAILRQDGDQAEAALVGYVVPSAGATPDPAALRAALGRQLPGHMVPSAIVLLDRLPLNANSKLDRKALPPPALGTDVPEPPADAAEAELARIWCEVLKLPRVGVTDSFFALGGHSMAALQVLARLRAAWPGSDVGIADLFNHATIRELARRLAQRQGNGLAQTVHLRREGRRPMLYCFPGLLVSTREYLKLVEALGPDQPATGFICYSLADGDRPQISVAEITARYAEEVRRQSRGRPCSFLGWSWGGLLAYEAARLLGSEIELKLVGMVDVCDMDTSFALGAVPRFAPGERAALHARIEAWLGRTAMRAAWDRLLARMDGLLYDQFLRFVGNQERDLPLDGPGLTSQERIFWVLIDNAIIFRRHRLVAHDCPIHAWAAGDSLNRGLEIIDWRRLSPQAAAAEIVPGTTHLDIIGDPIFHRRFGRRLEAALAPCPVPRPADGRGLRPEEPV